MIAIIIFYLCCVPVASSISEVLLVKVARCKENLTGLLAELNFIGKTEQVYYRTVLVSTL